MPIIRVESVKIKLAKKNLHEHVRGVRDKYQVWPLVPIATASLTANSQTCSTPWPPQTSCESLLIVDMSTRLDVSNELNSTQSHMYPQAM